MHRTSMSTTTAGLRVSQRPPTACRECSLRKVRCDKQTPCGRCVRLSRRCTREVVRISKALSQHRDELRFLRRLRARVDGAVATVVDDRIRLLEHGRRGADDDEADGAEAEAEANRTEALEADKEQDGEDDTVLLERPHSEATTTTAAALVTTPIADNPGDSSEVTAFEFLTWGRHTQGCFPHRRCACYQNRRYAELVSINSDATWTGRRTLAPPSVVDADVLLPPAAAAQIIQFHLAHLHWHHNAFHGPTFVARCRQFWATGTVDHPLWLALYLAVCSVSLWALCNAADHRAALALGAAVNARIDSGLVARQFEAMVQVLYGANFLEHLSLYAVQAIVVSTRIAHNLDRSELNATLVGAAVRIAHCLGLHKIADPPGDVGWHERIELETGKRVWAQLRIQDHFQIPFTDSYVIHPQHFLTPLPANCADADMVAQPPDVPTNSSYVHMLVRTAALMPPLLDGLGPLSARKSPADVYSHILACDRAMRANIGHIPAYLRDAMSAIPLPWIPLARCTLAISAAEKIIMIHRPVLFASFQSAAFQPTRAICVAAAVTILREHEHAISVGVVPIWTHSAFCVTGAVVVGLELFHRPDHTDDTAHAYRQMLVRAAARLRTRHCDAIARRGALLVDTLLAAEEDLVVRLMRAARPGPGSAASAAEHQRAIIHDMIAGHEILARFLARETSTTAEEIEPAMPVSVVANPPLLPELLPMDLDAAQDFDLWFNEVFAPEYDGML